MDIKCKVSKNTYLVVYGNDKVSMKFPKGIELDKQPFNETNVRNNAFSLTWSLSSMDRLNYDFGEVFFKNFILNTCYGDIPTLADERNIKTDVLFREFEEARKKIFFNDEKEKPQIFDEKFSDPKKAVILLSFGKDSLLSFGLASEIGMDVSLVFNVDTWEDSHEYNKKVSIYKDFKKNFKNKSYLLYDTSEKIHELDYPKHFQDFMCSTTLLHYTLLTMPIVHIEHAGSVIMGNEQNFNDPYINKDGLTAFVHPDQTSKFMSGFNSLLSSYTRKNVSLVSPVEPIYNLFEMKILHSRYPELLKYVMSCADDKLKKGSWWCNECPMCAKSFLYTKAFGFDAKKMHLNRNFFEKGCEKLYPVFNRNPERTYEKPPKVRDEQLLSFYLAYKNGVKGYLIDKFKKECLNEAKQRYEELHKTFFGIHPADSLPKSMKQDITSIYKEEMSKL